MGKMVPAGLNELDLDGALLKERIISELLDISIVYLHIIAPERFATSLPPITQNWGGFVQLTTKKTELDRFRQKNQGNRILEFRKFIKSIEVTDKPPLYFLHILLPHIPWEYNPSGKRYNGNLTPGLITEQWDENGWMGTLSHQRHLLQVGAVDKMVGELTSHLKEKNIYDKAMIILTSDHGCSFQANTGRRTGDSIVESDLMPVPFILKVPNQSKGKIIDDNVESIDVLPTIADALNIDIPWQVDGRSMLDNSAPRTSKRFYMKNYKTKEKKCKLYTFTPDNKAKYVSLKNKLALFGSGSTKPNGLFTFGPHAELVGKRINELSIQDTFNYHPIQLTIPFNNIDLESDAILPSYISGEISGNTKKVIAEDIALAVSINGIIQSTTFTYRTNALSTVKFYFVVPEDSFRSGENEVKIFIIETSADGKIQLLKTNKIDCSLNASNTVNSNGQEIPITSDAIQGRIDRVDTTAKVIIVHGWAVDTKKSKLIDDVVLFVNGEKATSEKTTIKRAGVAKLFKNPNFKMSGYNLNFAR
jgi:hypothetical protein